MFPIEPSIFTVLHLITIETDSYFDSISSEMRSVLQTCLQFKNPLTWIINLTVSKHYNNLKTYDVPEILNSTQILTFCYYCAPDYLSTELKQSFQITGKYIFLNLSNFNILSNKLGRPQFWTVPNSEYGNYFNINDYSSLKSVFTLPRENSLIFRFAVWQYF